DVSSMTMADFDLPDTMALRPSRRPPVGRSEFRAVMAGMASTVCVVSAKRGDELVGRTVTSVLSLSAAPPALLLAIDRVSPHADLIAKAGGFSLAMLATAQSESADAVADKLDAQHRARLGRRGKGPPRHPNLLDAVTTLECDAVGSME